MIKFLKNFGLGVVYMLLLPLFLIAVAFFMIYGIIMWFVTGVKAVISFFKAKEIFPPFNEDIQVERIRKAQIDMLANASAQQAQAPQTNSSNTTNSTVYVQQNYYQNQNQTTTTPPPQLNNNQVEATPLQNNNQFQSGAFEAQGQWVGQQKLEEANPFLENNTNVQPTPGLPHSSTLLENNTVELDDDDLGENNG